MVTGATESDGWLSERNYHGNRDAFVVEIAPAYGRLIDTYLGGSQEDNAYDIAVDDDGYAWVTGTTESSDLDFALPGTTYERQHRRLCGPRPAVPGPRRSADWRWSGWSKYLGGGGQDQGFGVAVDNSGYGWVTGSTKSPDWVFYGSNPYQGGGDAFVMTVRPDGSSRWRTLLGGSAGRRRPSHYGGCFRNGLDHRRDGFGRLGT